MTANNMAEQFDILFDSLYELAAPAYSDSQKSALLTKANRKIFFESYYPLANKYRKGFEMDEASLRDLEQYIKPSNPVLDTDVVGVHKNGRYYILPSDFLYAIEEMATITGSTDEILVKPVTHNQYGINRKNPYKKPYSKLVWRMGISRLTQPTGITAASNYRTELISDQSQVAHNVSSYRLRYLVNPSDIVVDNTTPVNQRHSLLNDMLQDKVVALAVRIATAAVKPEEYQIKSIESLDSE
jgi:hypothetical protein